MRHVALLRGVNVGGGNKVPMAELRALCEGMGWTDVGTYIASGNVVFSAPGDPDALAAQLQAALAERMGVKVPVLVLAGQDLIAALGQCPIEPEKGNHLHAAFAWDEPAVDWSLYEALKTASESLNVAGRIAWLHTPEGYGRSVLAEKLPRVLGVDITARNYNTLCKLAGML